VTTALHIIELKSQDIILQYSYSYFHEYLGITARKDDISIDHLLFTMDNLESFIIISAKYKIYQLSQLLVHKSWQGRI
jgi:hypothetical protein